MYLQHIVFVSFITCAYTKPPRHLPSYIKLCKRENVVTKCLLDNMHMIQPHLKEGIPELKIPSFDPLYIPSIDINFNNFHSTFSNINLYNLIDSNINNTELDLDHQSLNMSLFFPHIRIHSDYKLSGKLLLFNLDGKGTTSVNACEYCKCEDNVVVFLHMKGVPETRNKKEYIAFNDLNMDIDLETANVKFNNLFGDRNDLNEAANRIINENIDNYIKEIKPILGDTVGNFLFGIIRQVFRSFPQNELFPM